MGFNASLYLSYKLFDVDFMFGVDIISTLGPEMDYIKAVWQMQWVRSNYLIAFNYTQS